MKRITRGTCPHCGRPLGQRGRPTPVLQLDWRLVAPRPRPTWPTAGTVELCAGLRLAEAA